MNNILLICKDTPHRTIALSSALDILKRNFPCARISVISAYPYFFEHNPSVEKSYPLMKTSKMYSLLKDEKFDLAIITKPSFKYSLLAFAAGVKKRISPFNFYNSFLATSPVKIEAGQTAEQANSALLKPLFIYFYPVKPQIFLDKQEQFEAKELLREAGIGEKDKFVCVFAAAKPANLNCEKEFYARLNDKIYQKYKKTKVLFIATEKSEKRIVNEIFWRCINKPAVIRDAPELSVLSAVIAASQGIIGGCGLPAYLATALGKKSLIFAPFKAEKYLEIPPADIVLKPKAQNCEENCLKNCRTQCLQNLTTAQALEAYDKLFAPKNNSNKGIFYDDETLSLFNN